MIRSERLFELKRIDSTGRFA